MLYIDQMERSVEINSPVKRIVSLVPSQTEFLHHLGLEEEVVGITKFCIHPENWWRNKMRVGGTKNVDLEKVRFLEPDVIIGNKEENEYENIKELMEIAPVWMSDIKTLEEAYKMMLDIGRMADKESEAEAIVAKIKEEFNGFHAPATKRNALYFIWKNPWMLAGQETFISHLMEICHFENMATQKRYPILDEKKLIDCDLVLLSSEPYPFKDTDVAEIQAKFPNAQVKMVDGEMFSWYGSRLIEVPSYLQNMLTSIE
jgi:ABC-type Fe3+-hydroxamate transport system substrate-binding protein